MKQKLVSMFLAGVTLLGIGLYSATPASALDLWQGCEGATDSKVCASKGKDNVANTAKNLINLSLWAIGIVAVIMIVISVINLSPLMAKLLRLLLPATLCYIR